MYASYFPERLAAWRRANSSRLFGFAQESREELEKMLARIPGHARTKEWIRAANEIGYQAGMQPTDVLMFIARGKLPLDAKAMEVVQVSLQEHDLVEVVIEIHRLIDRWQGRMEDAIKSVYPMAETVGLRRVEEDIDIMIEVFKPRMKSIGLALSMCPPVDKDGRLGIEGGRVHSSPVLHMDRSMKSISMLPMVDFSRHFNPMTNIEEVSTPAQKAA